VEKSSEREPFSPTSKPTVHNSNGTHLFCNISIVGNDWSCTISIKSFIAFAILLDIFLFTIVTMSEVAFGVYFFFWVFKIFFFLPQKTVSSRQHKWGLVKVVSSLLRRRDSSLEMICNDFNVVCIWSDKSSPICMHTIQLDLPIKFQCFLDFASLACCTIFYPYFAESSTEQSLAAKYFNRVEIESREVVF